MMSLEIYTLFGKIEPFIVCAKGQLISEAIFHGFPYSKQSTRFFLQISAPASKMGEIQALYYIKYTLITNLYDVFIFLCVHTTKNYNLQHFEN